MPSGIPPSAKARHRLKSTMTKRTAVDWGRGIEESRVPVHKLIPALPHHRSDRPQEQRTDAGGSRDGNVNASFIWAPHPASTAVWKHNCNENPIDRSRFLLDKLHCFLCLSIAWKANVKSKDESPGDIIVNAPSWQADLVSTVATDSLLQHRKHQGFLKDINQHCEKANKLPYSMSKLANQVYNAAYNWLRLRKNCCNFQGLIR